jgi:hypothetical protein
MMMGSWEVQEDCLMGGWTNTWTYEEDGEYHPTKFTSAEEAQESLEEFLADLQREYEKGRMEDVPDRDTFRIVEVK